MKESKSDVMDTDDFIDDDEKGDSEPFDSPGAHPNHSCLDCVAIKPQYTAMYVKP